MYFMKSTSDHISDFMPLCLRFACCMILPAAVFSAFPRPAISAQQNVAGKAEMDTQQPQAELSNMPKAEFEYIIGDRKDPFVPFITEKATTADIDMNEIVDVDNTKLTGMQLFEPGQLTLVALMKSDSQDYAMVQDFTGKGYVINKGTRIGKRGVVVEIAPNKVVIEETAQTRAGQKIVTNTVMVLKKEGEE